MARRRVLVDPAVSRRKLEREVAEYYALHDDYIRRGWWLVKAAWPEVFIVFGIPQLTPPGVLFGAAIDFTDYDLAPPCVRLIHPCTQVPYKMTELPSKLARAVPVQAPPGIVGLPQQIQLQSLMQAFEDDKPFLCVRGTYDYHMNPGHNGDSWFLYRGNGEIGSLSYILNTLHVYGVVPVSEYLVAPVVKGFAQEQVPQ